MRDARLSRWIWGVLLLGATALPGCGRECDGLFYCPLPCALGAFEADSLDDAVRGCRKQVAAGVCGEDAKPEACECVCEI